MSESGKIVSKANNATQSQSERLNKRIVVSGENGQAMKNAVNSGNLIRTFANLSFRWEDEWRYEDFDDYTKVMADSISKAINKPIKNVVGKEPIIEEDKDFGIEFDVDNDRYGMYLRDHGNGSYALAYRKIK